MAEENTPVPEASEPQPAAQPEPQPESAEPQPAVTPDAASTPETPPGEAPEAPKGKGKKGKKRAILFLAVLLGLMVLLILLNTLDFDAIAAKFRKEPDDVPTQSVELYPEILFEIPDYNEDVTADADYMALDRRLKFENGAETHYVSENPEAYGRLCVFWFDYMNALVAGDARGLNAMHADDFVARLKKQNEFTQSYEKGFAPQKIYDFSVKLQDMQVLTDGDATGNYKGYTVYYFVVSYHIKDNNGTFRRDFIDEGDAVPLVYEVLEHGSELFINSQSRMRTVYGNQNSEEGINMMLYVWIGLILLAIVGELMSYSLTAVWFIPSGIVSLVLSILLPDRIVVQVVVYVVLSALLLVLTRPFVRRHLQKGDYQPTNADMVIGKIAVVTESIDNLAQTGEVSVDGKRWTARTADGSVIERDRQVVVLEIRGVKLICEGLKVEK